MPWDELQRGAGVLYFLVWTVGPVSQLVFVLRLRRFHAATYAKKRDSGSLAEYLLKRQFCQENDLVLRVVGDVCLLSTLLMIATLLVLVVSLFVVGP